jgi:NAD(P)-dependent dehydrogenase (short-subunit alcohol dehydrogenase family)
MAETQRVAIVTGAAGGIGRAMVRGLLAAGIRVAGVDRDREPLEALSASAREQGKAAELLTIAADLTDDSAVDAITKATHVKFGRIDILANNAGIGPGAIRPDSWQRPLKFWEITPDQWRWFVAVHTTAPLALTNAVVSEMMRRGWGRIVNVTTSLGTMLNAGSPTYGPSKAALEALSAIMSKDLDGTGVTVHVLFPGGITNTPMVSESGFDRAQMIQPEVNGAASPLARLGCRRESDGSTVSRCSLGSRATARTSGREGWGTGRLDQHCDNAYHAESLLAFHRKPSAANPSEGTNGSPVVCSRVGSRFRGLIFAAGSPDRERRRLSALGSRSPGG